MVLLVSFYTLPNSLRVRLDHNGLSTQRRLLALDAALTPRTALQHRPAVCDRKPLHGDQQPPRGVLPH